MTKPQLENPSFYLTIPAPCPYLPDQHERKVFTHLVGERAADLNDILTQGGFRRSQNIAYRPACEGCQACISVRVLVDEFRPGKSLRRIKNRNLDIITEIKPPEATREQFSVFRRYLDSRHQQGGMADMVMLDYAMMVEDSHVPTQIVEYRLPNPETAENELIAVALSDRMGDGFSMVYSFFDPEHAKRSLGTYMVLDHIRRAEEAGLAHVYLGYWVAGSPQMNYKSRFQPQEHLGPRGWTKPNI
ncbi:MAG: arginyltransferase [Pseudomonadota bacterium]